MVANLSLGPVQAVALELASINLAFAEVQERLDQQRGLRGRADVWDRQRVEDPAERSEALTAGAGADALDVIQGQVDALAGTVAALSTQVAGHETRLAALEAWKTALQAALPGPVSVTAVPTLPDAPATADALRDNLTTAWQPPVNTNDSALAGAVNAVRAALEA